MPFPVAHAIAGYAVYNVSKKKEDPLDWKLAAYCAFMGNFADLDFLPGLFVSKAGKYHHGIMHSFGAALFAGMIAAFIYQTWKKKDFVKAFLITSVSYSSHVVLDIMNGPWKGMPVFWPFSTERFFANPLARLGTKDFMETADIHDFFNFLTRPQMLAHMLNEIVVLLSVYIFFKAGFEIYNRLVSARRQNIILSKD